MDLLQFLDISNAIYISKWYQNNKETQTLVLFVMMKSQQRLYFTGAGLVDINAEAFEAVSPCMKYHISISTRTIKNILNPLPMFYFLAGC